MRLRFIGVWLVSWAMAAFAPVGLASTFAAAPVTQPKQPTMGYGSSANYVASEQSVQIAGSEADGMRTWTFVPNRLRYKSSAPVVVFLHGFQLTNPDVYQGHIRHLTRQGLIVIFPQINLGGLGGIASDFDQNKMLRRAIDSTNSALSTLGTKVASRQIHVYGHSLGGLLAAVWQGGGGRVPLSVTSANPSIDTSKAIPEFVQKIAPITAVDHSSLAKQNTARTIFLTGDADTIAAPAEAITLASESRRASSKMVYQATSNAHGVAAVQANHMAPTQNTSFAPDFIMDIFGGVGREDSLDWRYYYAALDANIAGRCRVRFDLGAWSDGAAIAAPKKLTKWPRNRKTGKAVKCRRQVLLR